MCILIHRMLDVGECEAMEQSVKEDEKKLITERIISVGDESGSNCFSVRLREVCDPDYGLFLWPSASVLAQFIHRNRADFEGKKVLEIGGGIGACGLVAALIGSSVTITDRHSLLIKSDLIQQNAQLNNVPVSTMADNPFGSVRVLPLTWGRFPSDFTELSSVLLFLNALISSNGYNELDISGVNEIIIRSDRGHHYVTSLAKQFGLNVVRELPEFPNTYTISIAPHINDKFTRRIDIIREIAANDGIEFTELLIPLDRQKRDYIEDRDKLTNLDKIKGIRQMEPILQPNIAGSEFVAPIPEPLGMQKKAIRFNDRLFTKQWYITNELTNIHKSHKIMEAWSRGYSGRGITVAILDDGLEYTHMDLNGNYNPAASYDFNEDDSDPSPRSGGENAHGTRCAGEVAMMANNILCGVGIAFNAQIAGIKLLDGTITDAVEGRSLAYQHQIVDIYSASWGPADNGETVEGPKRLAQEALIRGTSYGRRGRGSIYVWASGNGGNSEDNCNCDGYASSIYTISIGSVTQNGSFPWYGERCASTLAVTFSSGSKKEGKVATTDINNGCTNDHTGTSAAAPIAAGILALVLEANPNLSWRDIQHLIVWTSQVYPLKSNPGWRRNGAGLLFNDKFGFGLLDADKLTRWAKKWPSVPPQRFCNVGLQLREYLRVGTDSRLRVAFNVTGCRGSVGEVNYVEHVQLLASIDYQMRGALEIELISPYNTSSMLLRPRSKDKSTEGFQNWLFTSIHFWGERPQGYWILEIRDRTKVKRMGTMSKLALYIYGTKERPYHMSRKRHYENIGEDFDLESLESPEMDNFLPES